MEKSAFSMLTPALGAFRIKINAIKSVLTEEQKIAIDAYIESSAAKFADSLDFNDDEREMLRRYLE